MLTEEDGARRSGTVYPSPVCHHDQVVNLGHGAGSPMLMARRVDGRRAPPRHEALGSGMYSRVMTRSPPLVGRQAS